MEGTPLAVTKKSVLDRIIGHIMSGLLGKIGDSPAPVRSLFNDKLILFRGQIMILRNLVPTPLMDLMVFMAHNLRIILRMAL